MKRPLAFVAVLALIGLGVSAAFVLPDSSASGSAPTYTYPKSTGQKTTTQEQHTTTQQQEETTTEETTTEAAETTTTEETMSVATTTGPVTTAAPLRITARVRLRSNAGLHATVLVDQLGMTLYHFTKEKRHRVLCTGGCTSVWPPLLVSAGVKPLAGLGLKVLRLGTIRRPDGKLQVTYMGFPLYRFSGDKKPGDAKGNGFGNVWFALGPSGRLIGG